MMPPLPPHLRALDHCSITPGAKLVWIAIAHLNQSGWRVMTAADLEEITMLSNKTVRVALDQLIDAGLLSRQVLPGRGALLIARLT